MISTCRIFHPTPIQRQTEAGDWLVLECAAEDGGRYLLYRGDQPLLRREYMYAVHRTIAALDGEGVARLAGESVDPEKLVVDEGLFIGYPKSHDLRSDLPMTRLWFAVATSRVLEWLPFAKAMARTH